MNKHGMGVWELIDLIQTEALKDFQFTYNIEGVGKFRIPISKFGITPKDFYAILIKTILLK